MKCPTPALTKTIKSPPHALPPPPPRSPAGMTLIGALSAESSLYQEVSFSSGDCDSPSYPWPPVTLYCEKQTTTTKNRQATVHGITLVI